jgi:hypothetical protein
MKLFLSLLTLGLFAPLANANPAFEGDWMIELKSSGAPIIGLLELERGGDVWHGFVEGGPVPVSVDGDQIDILIDTRDLRGFIFFMHLKGELTGADLAGRFTIESEAKVNATDGTWSAQRYTPTPRDSEARPVNLSGIWTPAPGRDFRKYTMDLTPAAETWHAGYLMHYDQPNVRCVSPGITAMVAWGAYPFEILESEERLTFIYEFDSEVRRIFLDGRKPPEFYPNSGMGFSTGHWEGSELVVETTLLSQNTRDFRGEPVSEHARLEEVYTLSDDGQTMTAVITLHDPDNYRRPPIRRRAWVRKADADIYPNECDPDSFFRQMYNENLLDMYFERSRRRF